jgi:CRP-like cAMP-binding protein
MVSNYPSRFHSADVLLQRLSSVVALTAYEREFFRAARQRADAHAAGTEIHAAGRPPAQPSLIVSGWVKRERILPNGRRQILAILLPGDLMWSNVSGRPIDREATVAVNDVEVVNVGPLLDALAAERRAFAAAAQGLNLLRYAEDCRLLDSLVRIGCQTALERTAAFIVDLHQRCIPIGFVCERSFSMPLTQEMIGDALGISVVHVNRTVGQLKKAGLIDMHCGVVKILDLGELMRLASMRENQLSAEYDFPDNVHAMPLPAAIRSSATRPDRRVN